MMESNHYLIERESNGEIYCSRCGLYSPSEDESCVPMRYVMPESLDKAA